MFSALDQKVVACARALAADAVQTAGHGHPGTAMALAPAAYLLFQRHLRHNPADPNWIGRDRFVLSIGHSSLTLYTQLYLSGYGLEIDDLRKFRTLGSLTPAHPEYGHTDGVETTTGPLGQGVGAAHVEAVEGEGAGHLGQKAGAILRCHGDNRRHDADLGTAARGGGGDELFGGYPWRYYRATVCNDFEHYIDQYYGFWQRLLPNGEVAKVLAPVWSDVKELQTRDIFRDVFLTHEAPRPFHPAGRRIDAGKTVINEVLASMRPRLQA